MFAASAPITSPAQRIHEALRHDAIGDYRPGFAFALTAIVVAALPLWVVREIRDSR